MKHPNQSSFNHLMIVNVLSLALVCFCLSLISSIPTARAQTPDNTKLLDTTADGTIERAITSPDGRFVIYRLFNDDLKSGSLLRVNIRSRAIDELAPGLNIADDFDISVDRKYIIFRATNPDRSGRLFRMPIGGGTPVQLNNPNGNDRNVSDFKLSPDGKRVVYATRRPGSQFKQELYSVPVEGGDSVSLFTGVPSFHSLFLQSYEIDPTSKLVAFATRDREFRPLAVFSIPIDGGSVTKLNKATPAGVKLDADTVLFSPDGEQVFYVFGRSINSAFVQQVVAVPAVGPADQGIELNDRFDQASPVVTKGLFDLTVTSDKRFLVAYRLLVAGNQRELIRIPTDGSKNIQQLSQELESDRSGMTEFRLTPDGSTVIYEIDVQAADVFDVFALSLESGEIRHLPNIEGDEDVLFNDFIISPDGEWLAYHTGIPDIEAELHLAPIGGNDSSNAPGQHLATETIQDEEEFPIEFSQNSRALVFISLDLQSLFINEFNPVDDELCFPVKAKNDKIAMVCL